MRAEPAFIEAAFVRACITEIEALKPGNVHVHAGGHGMQAADFIASAHAAAPHIADPRLGVGERIHAAMRATWESAGQNTNLGIILLCAPLAAAAEREGGGLRDRLRAVLDRLTVEDAEHAFRAIALANPGGLGSAPGADVRAPASVTLLEAMLLAADRDLIARQYKYGHGEVFGLGLSLLEKGLARFGDMRWAAAMVYLLLLSKFPDTHIWRKHGHEAALGVRDEAVPFAEMLEAADNPQSCVETLMTFDASLKARGLNPGAIADLTVATLFAWNLLTGMRDVA